MPGLRILIADDHDLIRRGIRTVIESRKGWEICGEAVTGLQAIAKAEELKPDIAIIDISMPELNGMEAAKRIRKVSEKTEILMLSAHYSDHIIREVIDTGIRGFLVKADTGRDLTKAIENLSMRRPFYSSYVTDVIANPPRPDAAANPKKPSTRVTSRESEIIQTLSEGKSSKEVAVLLNISVKTVETHRANIMRKLELHTVSELVRYAIRNQIIEA